MSVRSAQSITTTFVTSSSTGAATNADSTPTGTLYVNGTANGATVTVTNITTGLYKVAVTLPTLAIGDLVEIVISATVGGVAAKSVVWGDTKDIALDSAGVSESNIVQVKGDAGRATVLSDILDGNTFLAVNVTTVSGESFGSDAFLAFLDMVNDYQGGTFPVTLADGPHGGTTAVLTLERMVVTSATTNQPAVKFTGNGSGAGLQSIGDALGSGAGIQATGGNAAAGIRADGGLGGSGIRAAGSQAGNGIEARGGTTSGASGIRATAFGSGNAGILGTGSGSGPGIQGTGGTASGQGIAGVGGAPDGHGMSLVGQGNGDDLFLVNSDAPTIGAAWGASIIGNGRARDYFLQGGANKIEFAADGESFTVYMTDDLTPLYNGTSGRLAASVGGLRSIDPV